MSLTMSAKTLSIYMYLHIGVVSSTSFCGGTGTPRDFVLVKGLHWAAEKPYCSEDVNRWKQMLLCWDKTFSQHSPFGVSGRKIFDSKS